MRFNRKNYRTKRRSAAGQAILEYIIIIAIVAVSSLLVLSLFADRIKQLIAGSASAIGSKSSAQAAGEEGDSLKTVQEMDQNGPSEINF